MPIGCAIAKVHVIAEFSSKSSLGVQALVAAGVSTLLESVPSACGRGGAHCDWLLCSLISIYGKGRWVGQTSVLSMAIGKSDAVVVVR